MGMGTKFFLGRGYYQGTKGTKVGVLIRQGLHVVRFYNTLLPGINYTVTGLSWG